MPILSTGRAGAVFVTLIVLFGALLGRVAYLQTYGRQQTVRKAERQHYATDRIPARRGGIFDRNGLAMAGTVQNHALFIDPKFMVETFQQRGRSNVEMDEAIGKLARLVDKEPFELLKLLGEKADSRYVKVAEDLDEVTCREIQK